MQVEAQAAHPGSNTGGDDVWQWGVSLSLLALLALFSEARRTQRAEGRRRAGREGSGEWLTGLGVPV